MNTYSIEFIPGDLNIKQGVKGNSFVTKWQVEYMGYV